MAGAGKSVRACASACELAGAGGQTSARRSFVRVLTPDVRARLVASLREGGNVRRAAAAAGVGTSAVYRLRKRDPRFAAAWDAGVAAGPSSEAGGYLPVIGAGEVLRRGKGKRVQVARLRAREWSIADDERFFAELAATANVEASAEAAGHSAPSAYQRRMKWPAFAEGWAQALEQGYARLEMRLVRVAADGPRRPRVDGAAPEPAEFDPQIAIHVLRMHAAAVKGGPGRRRGGLHARREPTIEEVRESIMRKIDAIERAEGREDRLAKGPGTHDPARLA